MSGLTRVEWRSFLELFRASKLTKTTGNKAKTCISYIFITNSCINLLLKIKGIFEVIIPLKIMSTPYTSQTGYQMHRGTADRGLADR